MAVSRAAAELALLKDRFPLLPDTPAIYPVWESLVVQYQILGKPAHDVRLAVASMRIHGLTSILTFDKTGFTGDADIKVVNPADVVT